MYILNIVLDAINNMSSMCHCIYEKTLIKYLKTKFIRQGRDGVIDQLFTTFNFTSVHSSRVVVNSVSCSLIGTSPKCPTSCYAVSPVLTMASTAGTSPTRRHFHSPTANLRREIDRRSLIASAPRVDEGTQGEKIHDIDYLIEE